MPQALSVRQVRPVLNYNQLSTARQLAGNRSRQALADDVGQLAAAIYAYQRSDNPPPLEAKLGQLLQQTLTRRVKPILTRRLRPDDVEDVLSEITIAVWRYRHSIRSEEVGRFIHAVAHRKLADQLRKYYKDAGSNLGNPETERGSLIDLLPAHDQSVAADDEQVWEMLRSSHLSDQDLLVAYFVYLSVPKGEIASALGISPNTVTNALKRCREQITRQGASAGGGHA